MRLLRGRQTQKTTSGGTVLNGPRGLFILRESPTATMPASRLARLITRVIFRERSLAAATTAAAVLEESPAGSSGIGHATGGHLRALPAISMAHSTSEGLVRRLRIAGLRGRIGPAIRHRCGAQVHFFGRGHFMSACRCVLRLTTSTRQEGPRS